MKKLIILVAVLALGATLALAQNKANFATDGGAHNITGATSGASGCTVCHDPHNGVNGTTILWALAYPTTGAPFATYTGSLIVTSPTALGSPTNGADPKSRSFLCLSCHDGVAGPANFSGPLAGATRSSPKYVTNGTTNSLTDDHPLNFTYPDPLPAGATGAFATLATLQASANVELYGSPATSVQCATCHDPHKQNPVTTGKYLRTSTTTALCVTCHL